MVPKLWFRPASPGSTSTFTFADLEKFVITKGVTFAVAAVARRRKSIGPHAMDLHLSSDWDFPSRTSGQPRMAVVLEAAMALVRHCPRGRLGRLRHGVSANDELTSGRPQA